MYMYVCMCIYIYIYIHRMLDMTLTGTREPMGLRSSFGESGGRGGGGLGGAVVAWGLRSGGHRLVCMHAK